MAEFTGDMEARGRLWENKVTAFYSAPALAVLDQYKVNTIFFLDLKYKF